MKLQLKPPILPPAIHQNWIFTTFTISKLIFKKFSIELLTFMIIYFHDYLFSSAKASLLFVLY